MFGVVRKKVWVSFSTIISISRRTSQEAYELPTILMLYHSFVLLLKGYWFCLVVLLPVHRPGILKKAPLENTQLKKKQNDGQQSDHTDISTITKLNERFFRFRAPKVYFHQLQGVIVSLRVNTPRCRKKRYCKL